MAVVALVVVWCLFGVVYLAGRRRAAPQTQTTRRSATSRIGIALQLLGYAIVFFVERPSRTPIVPMSAGLDVIVMSAATLLGIASLAFCQWAAHALGKQWSMAARVVAGHELIQQGPFSIVRNPI